MIGPCWNIRRNIGWAWRPCHNLWLQQSHFLLKLEWSCYFYSVSYQSSNWNSWRNDPWPSASPLWFCFFAACSDQKLTGFHFALRTKRNHFFSWLLSSNFWSSMETSPFWKWFLWDAHLHNFHKLIVSQLVMDSLTSPVSTKSQSVSSILLGQNLPEHISKSFSFHVCWLLASWCSSISYSLAAQNAYGYSQSEVGMTSHFIERSW